MPIPSGLLAALVAVLNSTSPLDFAAHCARPLDELVHGPVLVWYEKQEPDTKSAAAHSSSPGEKKELRILAPFRDEVYVIRKALIRCNIALMKDVLAIRHDAEFKHGGLIP